MNALFPAKLTVRNQWCLWRIESDRKGRPTKIPYILKISVASRQPPAELIEFRDRATADRIRDEALESLVSYQGAQP